MTAIKRCAVALAAALTAVLPLPAAVATGATGQAERPTHLELVAQTTWVGEDQRFDVRLALEPDREPSGLEIAVTVFARVPFRSQFAQTIEGRLLGSVLDHEATPVADLPRAADGTVTVTRHPPLRRPGVYPVRVELRHASADQPLDRFTTHLIHAPAPPSDNPLAVSLVLPVNAGPAFQPDGTPQVRRAATASIAAISQALLAHPRVAVTTLPVPETVAALAAPAHASERPELAGLARAVAARPVLASPYVPIDIGGLLDAGLSREADVQLERGAATVRDLLAAPLERGLWIAPAAVDNDAVEWLLEHDIDRLLIREEHLEPVRLETTLTAPFEVAVPVDGPPIAASIDSGLTAHFDDPDHPVLTAHRVLADLAVVYFDHPGRPGRGIVAMPSLNWRADAAFLAALLGGLRTSPILSTKTLSQYFSSVPVAEAGRGVLSRRLRETEPGSLPTSMILNRRAQLDSFASLLEPDNGRDEEFERLLLAAQRSGLSPRRRLAYLDGMRSAIAAEVGLIEIPDQQSVRLTAREGEVPISILSRLGYPVRVAVRVESNTLDFPHGGERLVRLTRETTIERIPVHARSSGAFPLQVELRSPDGSLPLARSRFTIRSTAASWVGLVLSAGAALFLVVWWGRHIHGRRSGKLVPT